ncbi:GH15685 [Drosophila grimshawi]|uniref:GH15685 n=1 Tax=Drosophila grimshawi TaxID=7222 RepID=B4IZ91_DROGR|nr:GH15685 [Drosophila grimshawi]
MKLFLVAFAVIAAVAADVSNEYLPPLQQEAVQTVAAPSNEYLAPVANDEASYGQVEQGSLAQDGYRYKTQRRRVLRRHRRDVSHLPSNDYLPPVQEEAQVVAAPTNEYLAPVANDASYAQVEQGNLADDGYRYKTHRRVVYRRNRRDVSHLPSNEYLPPVAQAAAPVPSNDYLPPVQTIAAPAPAPAPIQFAPVPEAAPAHELADDGYRYKTHRRVVYRRHRRDVSHLPTNEYLPPVQEEAQVVAAPTNEYLAPVANDASYAQVEQGSLAQDGYRYKTQRRRVLRRHRRDVSHLPSNDYLPPVQEEAQVVAAPTNEYLAPVANDASYAQVEQGNLADDGYRYKTHRRVVYRRNRRDVSHLPSNEYLPPVAQAAAPVPSNDYLPPVQTIAAPVPAPAPVQYAPVPEAAPAHELADDGYRYKTHRRVVYRRNRRDVSHLPSNEYLPPVAQAAAPVPSNDYLPPVQTVAAPVPAPAPVQYAPVPEAAPAHELADDGYRYKTHRRVVYRRRH